MSSHQLPPPWQAPGDPPPPPGAAPPGPPPPPPALTPAASTFRPPPPPGATPLGTFGGPVAPLGFDHRPPRPAARLAAVLMMVGGVLTIIGTLLPWLGTGEGSINGFDPWLALDADDPFEFQEDPGAAFVLFAVVLIGFGITTLAARRLLPIMILGIIVGAFALLFGVAELAHYEDTRGGLGLGVGLPAVVLGSAVGLAGAIVGCVRRRR